MRPHDYPSPSLRSSSMRSHDAAPPVGGGGLTRRPRANNSVALASAQSTPRQMQSPRAPGNSSSHSLPHAQDPRGQRLARYVCLLYTKPHANSYLHLNSSSPKSKPISGWPLLPRPYAEQLRWQGRRSVVTLIAIGGPACNHPAI